MKLLSTVVTALGAATLLFLALPSFACTNPENGAENPNVNGRPGRDGTPTGMTSEPPPTVEMPRPAGEPAGSTNPDLPSGLTENPGPDGAPEPSSTGTPPASSTSGGEALLDTQLVEVSWTPAKEVDGDPNNSGYWSHGGHTIATRVQVKDVATQTVVFEETVAQYDYDAAVKGSTAPVKASFAAKLSPGRYEARVQSVFVRHDETRFGMTGAWQKTSSVTRAPPIDSSVPAAKFVIQDGADSGGVSAGCTTTGGQMLQGLFLLVLAAFVRRGPMR